MWQLAAVTPGLAQTGGDPLPEVRLGAEAHAAEEGGLAGRFIVRRTGAVEAPLEVEYQIGGGASNGSDYRRLSGRVTIAAGESSAVIPVQPLSDLAWEPAETVVLTLAPRHRPFSLAVLPDTQYYVSGLYGAIPEVFTGQTTWIRDHKDEFNIVYVLHEGDLTENNAPVEWQRVKASMNVLEAVVPYAVALGNHDGWSTSTNKPQNFNWSFSYANEVRRPTFGGVFESNRTENCYHLFSAGGLDWLVLCLEYGPRNVVLDWANQVVGANPRRKVILLTHAHVFTDNTLHGSSPTHDSQPTTDGRENNGVDVWEKLLRRHPNVALAFSGHNLGRGTGRLVGTGDAGNRVYQMLANYQTWPGGGAGYLRLVQFFPEEDKMSVRTYSPYLQRWLTDSENQFDYLNLGLFTTNNPAYLIAAGQATASLVITNDDSISSTPKAVSLGACGLPPVFEVAFDAPLERPSAEDLAHYSMSGAVRLTSARLSDDGQHVLLTTDSALRQDETYTLTVSGVRTQDGAHEMAQPATLALLYKPVLMADDFNGRTLKGWTVVDEGRLDRPSLWVKGYGRLCQLSNIYGPHLTTELYRRGTFAYWNDPAALGWSNYTLSVSFRSGDDDGLGVLFHYQDPLNYHKLELDAQRDFRRLVQVTDGAETTLATQTGGYVKNWDHRLSVEASNHLITVRLDDVPLFGGPVSGPGLTKGTIGLYTWGCQGVAFSNLVVRPFRRAPQVSILTPERGWHFNPRIPATLTAEAAGLDAPIMRVDWLDETNLLQSVFDPPYRYDWSNAPPGSHVLFARAVDEAGAAGFSDPVRFEVGSVSVPLVSFRPPPDDVATVGDGVLWGVKALGRGPVSYRWFRGTQPIPGATNSFFFLNSLRPTDAGEYWAEIRTHGSVSLSQVLTLTVHDPPYPPLVQTQLWGRLSIAAVNDGRVPILSLDARPGSDVLIESSVELTNWLPLLYLTNVSARLYFTDPDPAAPFLSTRFYRAVPSQ